MLDLIMYMRVGQLKICATKTLISSLFFFEGLETTPIGNLGKIHVMHSSIAIYTQLDLKRAGWKLTVPKTVEN